ncbi:DUF192 domain-containing protein [Shimia sp.]|uniref:DUF192 domain-containing protein n=1 Tax=Shimia sp. TaxID=1954381 RepID=UPI00329900E9
MFQSGAVLAAGCSEQSLELRGPWGQARFNVEVADTEQERAVGLMNRKSMPGSAGMLFVYDRAGRVSFWMRNTLIPLDMLFADDAGVIQRIHHNAVPLDETPIPGGDSVRYVLEINGGLAQALGLTVGSEMRHPVIPEGSAAWGC